MRTTKGQDLTGIYGHQRYPPVSLGEATFLALQRFLPLTRTFALVASTAGRGFDSRHLQGGMIVKYREVCSRNPPLEVA